MKSARRAFAIERERPLDRQVDLVRPELEPGGTIRHPGGSAKVVFEGELGIVIGRTCKQVSERDALAHVLGYTVSMAVFPLQLVSVALMMVLGALVARHQMPVLVRPHRAMHQRPAQVEQEDGGHHGTPGHQRHHPAVEARARHARARARRASV